MIIFWSSEILGLNEFIWEILYDARDLEGHSVADYINLAILKKLEEMEKEEELRTAPGEYDSDWEWRQENDGNTTADKTNVFIFSFNKLTNCMLLLYMLLYVTCLRFSDKHTRFITSANLS